MFCFGCYPDDALQHHHIHGCKVIINVIYAPTKIPQNFFSGFTGFTVINIYNDRRPAFFGFASYLEIETFPESFSGINLLKLNVDKTIKSPSLDDFKKILKLERC
jgi:hypothetical protein